MDAKSLAKSKRAHTQHLNKKHHPKPTSKAPAAGVGAGGTSSQKPNVKQFKGSKKLPSNWDRYEDEDDLDFQGGTSQVNDVVVPKSKGSDYAYLISEAKAQAQSSYPKEESFPSFDDVFADFREEVGSLLSVRGENILSWAAEDDFLSEDQTSGVQEASFLSMDLNALAEQLAKVDLSERLFMEADLLPPELPTEELQTSRDHACTSEIPIISETTNETSPEISKEANQIDWDIEVEGTADLEHVQNEISQSRSRSDESSMPESKRRLSTESALIQNRSHSGFKVTDAEAELDMLLGSFSDPKFSQSTPLKEEPRYSTSTILSEETTSDLLVSTRVKNGLDQSKAVSTLDDSLDDLLKETSNGINQDIVSRYNDVKTVSSDVRPSPSSPTKSKLLDDFDSWLDTI